MTGLLDIEGCIIAKLDISGRGKSQINKP